MSTTKWDGAEEPTNNNSIKSSTKNFEYDFKSTDRPKPSAVFHIN